MLANIAVNVGKSPIQRSHWSAILNTSNSLEYLSWCFTVAIGRGYIRINFLLRYRYYFQAKSKNTFLL